MEEKIKGFKIEKEMKVSELVNQMGLAGFQASNVSQAVNLIKKMKKEKAVIFLSFTANMVTSGLREVFANLCKNKMIDVIVTSIGGVEEDLMKSFSSFLLGDFELDDKELHKQGLNRVGNILIPNKSYEDLEDFLMPFFKKMLEIQKKENKLLSPSRIIFELGKSIKDENSFLYWAAKNNIKVICPSPTDGAFGLQLFFFKQKFPEFGIDITADMSEASDIVLNAEKTGAIILGGGAAKHHTIGLNLLREGLDYAVYVTTAGEYDGSLSGAKPKEAKSWGKIKEESNVVSVVGDAVIIFPLIVSSL